MPYIQMIRVGDLVFLHQLKTCLVYLLTQLSYIANQGFYTALYKFSCFSSCLPKDSYHFVEMVFTLEHRNDVLGRACVDIRVCASPGRDRKVAVEAMDPPLKEKHKRKS